MIFFKKGLLMFLKNKYSFSKGKKFLFLCFNRYKKKEKNLKENEKREVLSALRETEQALLEKNKNSENQKIAIDKLTLIHDKYLKKNPIEKFLGSISTLLVAVLIAIVVRQMWFENYVIPSGSMRPTLKEKDFLIVSKTTFAINKPTVKGHFYFDENLINRGDTTIFTTKDMDVRDSDYMYLYIIPGKKQFIKRLIAKPGDTIYFYGGHLYGIDKDGKEIEEFQNEKWFTEIEHIPFIRFEGTKGFSNNYLYNGLVVHQMNIPLATLSLNSGKLLYDNGIQNYYDIWGFKNYAETRILSYDQAQKFYPNLINSPFPYYLELIHHPSVNKPKMIEYFGHIVPSVNYAVSLLPLDDDHIRKILENLTTCRFKVQNGRVMKVGYGYSDSSYAPILNDIPDGVYEFQNGIAYKVNFTGLTFKVPKTHPLYQKNNERIALLYNLGIEMNTLFLPNKASQFLRPSRYAYFRDENLYLMNSAIFIKEDPLLNDFVNKEKKTKTPFIDDTSFFLPNHKLNKEFILKYGLKIPEKHYLALGDNHAMSGDSREFGFVPQDNLRGKASFIYWPMQSRFGKVFQPSGKWLILPKIVVLGLAGLASIFSYIYYKKKHTLPLKF